ncbi:MAG: helix-turn-helix domain-containing protein [Bacteroidota bacterium]
MPGDVEITKSPDSGLVLSNQNIILVGQQTNVFHRYPANHFLAFQVIFQLSALYLLRKIPSYELTNQIIDAETIFGKSIKLVNEQLFYAKDYAEMICIVEQFLTTLIQKRETKRHPVNEISSMMLQAQEGLSVDKFLHAACLSHRQFDRKFKESTGIAPKQFLQLIRFDRAFRMKNRFPGKDWLSIALHCGYYDYQHLVKDYKEFTGYTPVQFFEIDNKAPERAFGEAEV